ncbi:MAG: hypothetical protein OXT67_07445, partial [Zetaproteobacteria bacterium]|nr:hypothetical protein [Zetaproteobacteria bacterium]
MPFRCDICTQRYHQLPDLQQHIRRKHPKQANPQHPAEKLHSDVEDFLPPNDTTAFTETEMSTDINNLLFDERLEDHNSLFKA